MKSRIPMHAVIAAFLIAIWFVAAYLPSRHDRQAVQMQSAEAEAQMADFNATIAQLPQMIARQQDLASKLEALNSKLYAKSDVLKLLDQLRHDAATFELAVTEITPSVSELLEINQHIPENGEPQFLNVTVRMKGDYLKFGRFVQYLEKTIYFRGITACQIATTQDLTALPSLVLGFRAQLGTTGEKS